MAVCDTPAGRYRYYGTVAYPDGTPLGARPGDEFQFDPGVLAEGEGAPGQVLEGRGRLVVACGQGAVELLELQAQGKKRMAAADYLRGHPLAPGTVLGI